MIILLKYRICKKRVRHEKYRPAPKQKQIKGIPQTHPLKVETISEKIMILVFKNLPVHFFDADTMLSGNGGTVVVFGF